MSSIYNDYHINIDLNMGCFQTVAASLGAQTANMLPSRMPSARYRDRHMTDKLSITKWRDLDSSQLAVGRVFTLVVRTLYGQWTDPTPLTQMA